MSALREIDIPEYADAFFRKWGPGRLRILLLTFQFDPQVFEQRFARILRRGAIRVDVVSGESPTQPKREPYNFWLANWRGTFHPKMVILMANDRVAVGLGSANLTWGGLGGNLECWQFFEDNSTDRRLLANANAFLTSLGNLKVVSRKVELSEFLQALPSPETETIYSTTYGQLLGQISSKIRQPVRRLDVLSPVNSDPGPLFLKFRQLLGIKEVHLFTNMRAGKLPRIPGCDRYYDLVLPQKTEEDDKTVRRYEMLHAKMFAFYCGRDVHLFWGSANASSSAWLRTGAKANVDFLVHSRMSAKEWAVLRDKLPARHRWEPRSPAEEGELPNQEPEYAEETRLLNAVWDGRRLALECSVEGKQVLWLEVAEKRIRVGLNFVSGEAKVPKVEAERLGFGKAAAPNALKYRIGSNRAWREMPVNHVGLPSTQAGYVDVAAVLFWRYTGRPLPTVQNQVGVMHDNGDTPRGLDPEEEELTSSLHQGELDRFVLQWRLNLRRIVACSGNNRVLLKQRLAEAQRLVEQESRDLPAKWPTNHRQFIGELFGESLRKLEWRS